MAGNEVVPFERMQVPARLQQSQAAAMNADLVAASVSFPSLSIKGKVWHVVRGDERVLLTNPETGDPVGSIEGVLVKANPGKSKVYFKDGFVEGSEAKPDCSSNDGIRPDSHITSPMSATCAACKMNEFGSKITEQQKKAKACSDSKRVAFAAPDAIDDPFLLRVPADSLKPLTEYAGILSRRNVPYDEVVTRIGFDHTVAHPKLTFKFVRFLDDAEAAAVKDMATHDKVAAILGMGVGSAPALLAPPADDEFETALAEKKAAEAAALATAKAAAVAAKPAPKTIVTAEEVEKAVGAEITEPAAPAVKKGGFGAAAKAAAPAAKPAAKPAAPKVEAPVIASGEELDSTLDALIGNLDDA